MSGIKAVDQWYRQEYLCEFVDREGAVFSRDTIDGAYQDYEGLELIGWMSDVGNLELGLGAIRFS